VQGCAKRLIFDGTTTRTLWLVADRALTVDSNLPMTGMFKRNAEKAIIDSALKGLKKKVEG
jgi:hypothetical protein